MTTSTVVNKGRETDGRSRAGGWRNETTRYVKSVEGDIRQLPGSGTVKGSRAVSAVVRNTLDRVRSSIESRSDS